MVGNRAADRTGDKAGQGIRQGTFTHPLSACHTNTASTPRSRFSTSTKPFSVLPVAASSNFELAFQLVRRFEKSVCEAKNSINFSCCSTCREREEEREMRRERRRRRRYGGGIVWVCGSEVGESNE